MRHWPLAFVGAGVLGTGMVHGMRISQIPVPLRGLACERMPASDEAAYPPLCWGCQGRLYDVRATIDEVRLRFQGYTEKRNVLGGYDFSGPDGMFQTYPGVVWSYSAVAGVPQPIWPSPRGHTVVVSREALGWEDWLRVGIRRQCARLTGRQVLPSHVVGYCSEG